MPGDGAGFGRILGIRRNNIQIRGALGKKVNFAVIGAGKTLGQLSESMLHAVATIDKRRNSGETQVSESSAALVGRPGR